jgi:hypothetical protein
VLLALLFIGTLVFLIPLYVDPLPEVRTGEWREIDDEITLTSSNPSFQLGLFPNLNDLRIEELYTNGSPVTISALSGYNDTSDEFELTYWVLTNISRIENVPLTIDNSPDSWVSIVSIERQDEDVQVSFRVKLWDRVPSDIISAYFPDPLIFIFTVVVIWRISRLRDSYEIWFLCALIIMTLIAAGLAVPWIGGSGGGQFKLVYEDETVNRQLYSYTLDEVSSNMSIDLANFDVSPNCEMRIRNVSTGGIPLHLSIQNASGFTLITLQNLTGLGYSGLLLSENGNPSYVLKLQRLSQDVNVDFAVESFRRVLVPYSDSFPSMMVSLVGITLLVIVLVIASHSSNEMRGDNHK